MPADLVIANLACSHPCDTVQFGFYSYGIGLKLTAMFGLFVTHLSLALFACAGQLVMYSLRSQAAKQGDSTGATATRGRRVVFWSTWALHALCELALAGLLCRTACGGH